MLTNTYEQFLCTKQNLNSDRNMKIKKGALYYRRVQVGGKENYFVLVIKELIYIYIDTKIS